MNYFLMADRSRTVTRSMGHIWYGERRNALMSSSLELQNEEDNNTEVEGDEQVQLLPILPRNNHPGAQNGNTLQDERETWRALGRDLADLADSFAGRAQFPQIFESYLGDILNLRNLRQIYNEVFDDTPVTTERMVVYAAFLLELGFTSLNNGQILDFLMTFVAHSTEIFFQRHGGWFGLLQYGLLTMANKTSIGSIAISVRTLYYASVFFRSNTT